MSRAMIRDAAAAGLRVQIRLRDAARVHSGPAGDGTRIVGPSGGQELGVLTPAQHATLAALARGDHDEDTLLVTAADAGGAALHEVFTLLARLRAGDWLAATLASFGRPLLTVRPCWARTGGGSPSAADVLRGALAAGGADQDAAGHVVWSRFAQIHRPGDRLVLATPLAGHEVELHDPVLLGVVSALVEPKPPASVPVPPGLDRAVVRVATAVLRACRLVEPAGFVAEPELTGWSPHELWFHTGSRQGWHEGPWGATYPGRQRGVAPPPARHRPPPREPSADPASGADRWPLPRPDLDRVAAADPPLTAVLESRRSLRAHDDAAPLTAAQLGEFLYRTARTRRTWCHDGVELADRPYPSGGALHELELYPVIANVAGLPAGLYHYDGHAHALGLVAADDPVVRALGRRAARAATMTTPPQALIIVTARFGRVMWKYQSMAYALTLKNVGALYAAMYLVATAMNLAPCALGGGDSALFARASGLDYLAESSVGEFVLGSAPPTPATRPAHDRPPGPTRTLSIKE